MDDTALTIHEIQEAVHAWVARWQEGYFSPLANLARLTEEVGELARAINHLYGDKPPKATDEPDDVPSELADILFVVVTLANSLSIDLDAAFRDVMDKYEVRDADRFTPREPEG